MDIEKYFSLKKFCILVLNFISIFKSCCRSLVQILKLHGNFLANLLKKFARKGFFLLFFLRILIGR